VKTLKFNKTLFNIKIKMEHETLVSGSYLPFPSNFAAGAPKKIKNPLKRTPDNDLLRSGDLSGKLSFQVTV